VDGMTKQIPAPKLGAEFDRAYTLFVIQENNRTALQYQREVDSGTDPALKKFASDTIPILTEAKLKTTTE
jgi:predicted outer membrane protein